jgi:hypothetical protein
LRDCLKVRQQKQPDVWTTFNTQSMLGGSLLGQKKYAEAEPLLLEGYQGMKQREAQIPKAGQARLGEALDRLVELYEAWDKKAEAAKWRAVRDGKTPASATTCRGLLVSPIRPKCLAHIQRNRTQCRLVFACARFMKTLVTRRPTLHTICRHRTRGRRGTKAAKDRLAGASTPRPVLFAVEPPYRRRP